MDVGRIFYAEKNVIAYSTLGIGRLIYSCPSICAGFSSKRFSVAIRFTIWMKRR